VKIRRVVATLHRVPVAVPLLAEPRPWPVLLVRVETDDGAVGHGVAGTVLGWSVLEFINRELGPFLVGRDPLLGEQWWSAAERRFNQRALTGVVSCGLSGVDIALWDLRGHLLGRPVWQLLGGYAARVPAYVTFGLPEYDADQLVEAARLFRGQGHDKLKMVVGRTGRLAEDVERVRRVREAVGPAVELMVDANESLDLATASACCRLLEPFGVTWFEEPVAGNDVLQLAELRRRTRISISAGQNEGHKWRHRELILGGAVDVVQTNVLFVGGYTEAVKVAHLAEAFRLPIANGGGWPDHNAHLIAAVPNGWRVELHAWQWNLAETLYQDPPRAAGGWLELSERPGLGLEPRPEVLADTLVRG
jgi:L-rhamnonate dehydratase